MTNALPGPLQSLKDATARVLRRVRFSRAPFRGDGLSPADRATIRAVARYAMTSRERVVALCDAIRYVCRSGIAGDIVECGVAARWWLRPLAGCTPGGG
jgi:hypothetical protein